ncbi:MAG: DUF748 domain-containing protein [Bacteroidetes bacterium]|nr:MAG: DUF748 domain-containing protein [Bacteroidota bacterium]
MIIVISSIIITVIAVIIFVSPLTKYLVEKYDEKYLGRQITMDWVYVNPFTGYVHISNLKIYESKVLPSITAGDSIFFSAKGVSANFAMLKLLSNTIEIEEVALDHPKGIVIQNQKIVNFSDWIKLFTPKKPHTTPSRIHFNILNIIIQNGEFTYHEKVNPFNYFIREVNLESKGKYWNSDTIAVKFSFLSGPGNGAANGNFTINFKKLDYRFAVNAHTYDLKFLEQYLKVLSNYGTFSANLEADIKATGNFKDRENINAKGLLVFNDFHCGKNPDDDYAACDKLALQIVELSPKNHIYLFDSLSLSHPYFKYERYDYLDNLQMMFGKNGTNLSAAKSDPGKFNLILTIAEYIKGLAKNFFQSDYKINRVAIYRGDFMFNDFSISEKFSASVNPLYFLADSINKDRKRVNVSLKSGIKPYGNISVKLSINPKDKGDYDMEYHLQKVAASMFNAYLISYTSFPLNRGTIEFNGQWNVRNGIIQSINHLVIIDPRVSKRLRNKDKKWLPLPLIMSLIRERGNVIDYEIPITGNLKDPKFHLHDILVDLIENIFVKPATAPYRMQVKNLETEIEKSLTLKWEVRQSSLLPDQEKFVGKMVDFLKDNPDASISVYPFEYAEKETEYIQFFEAKKIYFLLSENNNNLILNEADSLVVDKMSVKDTVFVHYLNKMVNDTMLFTIQEKCKSFLGPDLITSRFKRLTKEREDAFILDFTRNSVQNRVKIHIGENDIPYDGFSFYKIVYKGELPDALIKAYRKMNELNNEAPREKYKNERKQNKNVLSEMQIL